MSRGRDPGGSAARQLAAAQNDTGWINLTLASGFTSTDGGAGGDAPAQVRRIFGVVYLQGVVSGTFTAGVTATIVAAGGIPAGLRSFHKRQLIVYQQAGGIARVIVNNTGAIFVIASTTSTYVDLSGASGYIAEA